MKKPSSTVAEEGRELNPYRNYRFRTVTVP